jgi:hypothetical protein
MPDSPLAAEMTAHQKFYTHIGYLVITWSSIEANVRDMLRLFMDNSDLAHVITSQLGNVALTDIIRTLTNDGDVPDEGLRDHIDHFLHYFDRMREHRNYYAHSISSLEPLGAGESIGKITTYSAKKRLMVHEKSVPLTELNLALESLSTLRIYGQQVYGAMLEIAHYNDTVKDLQAKSLPVPPAPQPSTRLQKFPLPDRLQKSARLLIDAPAQR